MPRRIRIFLAALAVFVSACASAATPDELAALPDVEDVEQLATAFNQAQGSPRLILLLSPT